MQRIFHAHFVDGADIGNQLTLTALAAEQGMDPVTTALFLASTEGTEAVHSENLHAHRLGINGVPCFLIDGEHAIAGAQETEVLERLLTSPLAPAASGDIPNFICRLHLK